MASRVEFLEIFWVTVCGIDRFEIYIVVCTVLQCILFTCFKQKKMKDSGDEDGSEDDKAEKPNKKMVGKAKGK